MGIASLAYLLMCIGLHLRKKRAVHIFFMNCAIFLDIALVLTLEIQRDAIDTAFSFTLLPLQQAHIVMSSIATLLYIPVLYLGWRGYLKKLTSKQRSWHLRLGISAYFFRTMGFILMFTLIETI